VYEPLPWLAGRSTHEEHPVQPRVSVTSAASIGYTQTPVKYGLLQSTPFPRRGPLTYERSHNR